MIYEDIAGSEIDKFIKSLKPKKHNKIYPIYCVDPEEELLACNSEDINCKRKWMYVDTDTPNLVKLEWTWGIYY